MRCSSPPPPMPSPLLLPTALSYSTRQSRGRPCRRTLAQTSLDPSPNSPAFEGRIDSITNGDNAMPWSLPRRARCSSQVPLSAGDTARSRTRTQSTPFYENTMVSSPIQPSTSTAFTSKRAHRRSSSIYKSTACFAGQLPNTSPWPHRRPRSPTPPSRFRYSSPPPPVPPIPACVLEAVKRSSAELDSITLSITARATRARRQAPVLLATPPTTPPSTPPRLHPQPDHRISTIVDFYIIDDLEPLSSPACEQAQPSLELNTVLVKTSGWTCAAFLGHQNGQPKHSLLA
jgi:hypothetical protein